MVRTAQPNKSPNSISAAVAGCDRTKALASLAAKLAKTLDATDSARDVAALSKQLRDTLAELDAAQESGSAVPDVIKKAVQNRRKP